MKVSLEYESNNKKTLATGERYEPEEHIIIKYVVGRYDVFIKLSPDNKFKGIERINVNKDFRRYREIISNIPFRFIDEYEPDERVE